MGAPWSMDSMEWDWRQLVQERTRGGPTMSSYRRGPYSHSTPKEVRGLIAEGQEEGTQVGVRGPPWAKGLPVSAVPIRLFYANEKRAGLGIRRRAPGPLCPGESPEWLGNSFGFFGPLTILFCPIGFKVPPLLPR